MNTIALRNRGEVAIDADEGIAELYTAHYAQLVRLAVLLLRDQATAEDVVQDAYIALHRRWHRVEVERAAGYLRRSVVNGSRSVLRHRAVRERYRPDRQPDHPGAEESVLGRERRAAVLAALDELPRRQREVIALRYYLDLSEREIAEALDISTGAVKSHASRGAARLRTLLNDQEQS